MLLFSFSSSYRRSSQVTTTAEPPSSDPPYPSKGSENENADASKKPVFSHALNENFAAEELIDELKDRQGFGKRGEVVLLAQLVLIFLVLFPPMQLKGLVFMCGEPLIRSFTYCAVRC